MLSKSNLWRALTILALLALLVTPFSADGWVSASQPQQAEGPTENGAGVKPVVLSSSRNDTSPALRDMKPAEARPGENREIPSRVLPKVIGKGMKAEQGTPAVVQNKPVEPNMPGTIANFEGINNVDGVLPPDTNGDIGVDPGTGTKYYMQWVNLSLQIWDVTDPVIPVSLYGPVDGNTLFSGFGGPCETTNDGDPIVLFDHLANRWLASQFSLPGPFYQCIAISQTADPTGAWHRYEFLYSNTLMNDYPKFGVWPDAYYMSINQFDGSSFAWEGAGAVAFERDAMLAGDPAAMVYFDQGAVTENYGGQLPSDLDGTPPPDGTPNFFAEWDDSSWLGDPTDTLRIWEFHVDWANPANSTFGLNANYDPNYLIPTSDVDPDMCAFDRACIPQPGGTALDAISDRLMFRLQYRNFGTYQALVSNHTVDVDNTDHAGVHWLELHDDGSGWDLYQDGVFAPDSANRWMGSAALDVTGNMALGYSVSSSSVYPSIRYTGRLVGDPLNTLPQGEAELIAGGGSQQSGFSRWGDYSMMGVDPVDQCTFWYTQEYYEIDGNAPWQTRIGSFKYPSCTLGPSGTLQGSVTDASSGDPIEGVKVSLGGGLVSYSDVDGFYQITNIPVGLYDVAASKFGYVAETASGVEILEDTTTVQNFSLSPAALVTVQGKVTDGSGHPGMPLYAKLDIAGYPESPIFTDPATGHYSLKLPAGETFTFNVSAVSAGYNTESRDVTPPAGGKVEHFALTIDAAVCSAPGYGLPGYLETFDSGALPAGWKTADNTGGGGWDFDDPAGRGNLTGGDGLFAIVDSDFYGPDAYQDAELISPAFDLSAYSTVTLEFDTDFNHYSGDLDEVADVDVSTNLGASWTNVWTKSGADYPGPAHESIDITGLAAGESEVFVRF
ncbi:MAG: hypothetical protein H6Q38_3179, partial [Chloroflexi bacterium]|nr:hypothetical protein [Chloroflexota bacterium]